MYRPVDVQPNVSRPVVLEVGRTAANSTFLVIRIFL
jgi:hypothetical protein